MAWSRYRAQRVPRFRYGKRPRTFALRMVVEVQATDGSMDKDALNGIVKASLDAAVRLRDAARAARMAGGAMQQMGGAMQQMGGAMKNMGRMGK